MALDSDPVIDWRTRADGKEHVLVAGTHYTRTPDKVRRAASMWGLRHDLRALTEIDTAKGTISVKFVPRSGKV